jgi:hypothetical protein
MSNYIEVDGLRVDPCMWRSKVEEVEQLRARVAELCDLIKYAQENSGVCMCGDDIKDHNQSSGHPPVDVWDHAVEQVDQGETSEALILRKQAEAVQASRRALSSCSEIPNSSGHASRQAVSVPDAWCVVTNDDQIQYTAMVDKNLRFSPRQPRPMSRHTKESTSMTGRISALIVALSGEPCPGIRTVVAVPRNFIGCSRLIRNG